MSSGPTPSLPNSIPPVRSLEASLERTDPNSESTGSVSDKDINKRICVHYRELTTIFNGTTRASIKTPNRNGRRRRTNSAVTPNYLFLDELSDEPMNTPDNDRCTPRRKGTTSTFDTTMNSITEASHIIQQNARPEADQKSL
ncbi:flagellar M-ring protein [Striga asiatica]|uniref:Flagellar M-ring protein n=1 Tax=Striga asiatica TaxID=4170 RepID=A0A5A7PNE4_STRAF|nr:flagellar M-ring protein [Striga asiatica]